MAGVHRRPESFRRPVGFAEIGGIATVDLHVGLVAVHVVDIVGGVEDRCHLRECRRHQQIVVVQEGDEFAVRHRQCIVGSSDDPAVLRPVRDANPRVQCRQRFESAADFRSCGAVVDDAPLPVRKCLRLHAVDARQECPERRIVDRGDDRESGTDGRRC